MIRVIDYTQHGLRRQFRLTYGEHTETTMASQTYDFRMKLCWEAYAFGRRLYIFPIEEVPDAFMVSYAEGEA